LLTTSSNILRLRSLEHSLLPDKEIHTEKSIVIRIYMEIHKVIFGTMFIQPF